MGNCVVPGPALFMVGPGEIRKAAGGARETVNAVGAAFSCFLCSNFPSLSAVGGLLLH